MKISIITACYNSEKYLPTTIESVLSQTYKDIEYIIIDGGSTDNTISIIKKYEPLFNGRMKWSSEKDDGIYDAMNKGIEKATGIVIGLINSDDFFVDKYSIEKVINIFKNEKVDSVFADLYYVNENNVDKVARTWKTGLKKSFASGWHPAHPSFYVRKEMYNLYGFFDINYKIAADFEIMLRFLEKYKISSYYLSEYLVKMRTGGESNRNLSNIRKGNLEIRLAFKKNDIKISSLYTFKRWFNKILQYF